MRELDEQVHRVDDRRATATSSRSAGTRPSGSARRCRGGGRAARPRRAAGPPRGAPPRSAARPSPRPRRAGARGPISDRWGGRRRAGPASGSSRRAARARRGSAACPTAMIGSRFASSPPVSRSSAQYTTESQGGEEKSDEKNMLRSPSGSGGRPRPGSAFTARSESFTWLRSTAESSASGTVDGGRTAPGQAARAAAAGGARAGTGTPPRRPRRRPPGAGPAFDADLEPREGVPLRAALLEAVAAREEHDRGDPVQLQVHRGAARAG